jgi:hypothetical protein
MFARFGHSGLRPDMGFADCLAYGMCAQQQRGAPDMLLLQVCKRMLVHLPAACC